MQLAGREQTLLGCTCHELHTPAGSERPGPEPGALGDGGRVCGVLRTCEAYISSCHDEVRR